MAMAGTGASALLSCSSKTLVSVAARNGVECVGRSRVSGGGALDVLFRKNCDLSRGLGAAVHLGSSSDVSDRSLGRTRAGGLVSPGFGRLRNLAAKAAVKEEVERQEASVAQASKLKEFLEDLKGIGRARLIVNTGVAVLESVTTFDKLFYHEMPGRGEFANLMSTEENVDFHLLLQKVKLAELKRGKSLRGDIPTYMVKFVDVNDAPAVSVLVMWKPGTDGEYDPGQMEAFEALEAKYGTEVLFIV